MATGSVGSLGLPLELTTEGLNQNSKSAQVRDGVNKDAFMQLLVAQLKNQDPLEPIKNENFLAQLASFSSLEQLVSIKEGVDKLAGIATEGTASSTEPNTQSTEKG